jgi:hypothetical protein
MLNIGGGGDGDGGRLIPVGGEGGGGVVGGETGTGVVEGEADGRAGVVEGEAGGRARVVKGETGVGVDLEEGGLVSVLEGFAVSLSIKTCGACLEPSTS